MAEETKRRPRTPVRPGTLVRPEETRASGRSEPSAESNYAAPTTRPTLTVATLTPPTLTVATRSTPTTARSLDPPASPERPKRASPLSGGVWASNNLLLSMRLAVSLPAVAGGGGFGAKVEDADAPVRCGAGHRHACSPPSPRTPGRTHMARAAWVVRVAWCPARHGSTPAAGNHRPNGDTNHGRCRALLAVIRPADQGSVRS